MTIKVEKATAPRGAGSSAPSASEPGITAAMMRPTAAMMRPLDILLRYQGDLLKAMEPEAMRWFARRQEDVQAGLNALERLSTSTDVETLVDVQRDWLRGAVERLQADLAALAATIRWRSCCPYAGASITTQSAFVLSGGVLLFPYDDHLTASQAAASRHLPGGTHAARPCRRRLFRALRTAADGAGRKRLSPDFRRHRRLPSPLPHTDPPHLTPPPPSPPPPPGPPLAPAVPH